MVNRQREETALTLVRTRPVAPLSWLKRDYVVRRLLAGGDAVAIIVGIAVAVYVAPDATHYWSQFVWGMVSLPVWILVFKMYGLYDEEGKRVNQVASDDVPRLFHALLVGGLGLWFFLTKLVGQRLPFLPTLCFMASAFVFVLFGRVGARALARRLTGPERVLFVGGEDRARLLAGKIHNHPEYGLDPVGYVTDSEEIGQQLEAEIPHLGHLSELEPLCSALSVDRILIASPEMDESALADVVRVAIGLSLRISILPHLVDVLGPSVEIDDVEGITVLGINPPALTRSSRLMKRSMDLVVSAILLVFTLPLMVVIAAAVKLSSPGPILFIQERIGRQGRPFRMFKFRTMVSDAEERVAELWEESAHPVWLVLKHDPRVTKVGRILRRTSLDELPQLWNVIRGEMSLVGPRPMTADVDERISGWGRRRLDLTPGVTGLWQVLGRADLTFEEMVKLDYLYVTNWSLWQDVRLLVRTLPAVALRRGAN